MHYSTEHNNLEAAKKLDSEDPLKKFREEFTFPDLVEGRETLYFAGHSLGLLPNRTRKVMEDELASWGKYGVEGHFLGEHPWLPYHEFVTESLSRLAGCKPSEVVAMNTLTSNLHLMLVSFYRPTKSKFKILIENNTFPSDKYAVDSQARFHGFDASEAVVELRPREGEYRVREEDIVNQIEELGDELALIMLGNCNYLSGQCFDMKTITELGHKYGAFVGFNLAHGAGNIELDLHDKNVDFAVWCSYKYLNSGPGGIAAAYVHEKHHGQKDIPRFEGWWGTNKETRFKMGPNFDPIPTVEAWQLSNPPIFQLAALRSSMQLYDEAGLKNLKAKSIKITNYLEFLLKENVGDFVEIMTPPYEEGKQTRGCMLSLRFKKNPKELNKVLGDKAVICDFREPDIIRATPIPLYNSFEDCFNFVQVLKEFANA
ncbi:MAG: kynureninase [Halobacteriovorax sp.]|nr:kynureninase [Halobacteriovorax sp.]|tara:strand:+ start:555955 stop:557241 length:1287 start_codon:yes stop_codon:yes gene_type:complete